MCFCIFHNFHKVSGLIFFIIQVIHIKKCWFSKNPNNLEEIESFVFSPFPNTFAFGHHYQFGVTLSCPFSVYLCSYMNRCMFGINIFSYICFWTLIFFPLYWYVLRKLSMWVYVHLILFTSYVVHHNTGTS